MAPTLKTVSNFWQLTLFHQFLMESKSMRGKLYNILTFQDFIYKHFTFYWSTSKQLEINT